MSDLTFVLCERAADAVASRGVGSLLSQTGD